MSTRPPPPAAANVANVDLALRLASLRRADDADLKNAVPPGPLAKRVAADARQLGLTVALPPSIGTKVDLRA